MEFSQPVNQKRSNILLLSAAIEKPSRAQPSENCHYPIGLGYLHAALQQRGHSVSTLFLNDHGYTAAIERVANIMEQNIPDYVGLQIITHNRVNSIQIIEWLHQNYPKVGIIIGGIHVTVLYEQLLQKFPYVVAVLGEGEVTLCELIAAMNTQGDISLVNGIAYLKDGVVHVTAHRDSISDLDILPIPAHDVFFSPGRTMAGILTTRGCPFACSFCCLNLISERKVRYRSINSVIAEIKYLLKTHKQVRKIWIHDDSFFLDNQRVIAFCNKVIEEEIKVEFVCSGRFKPLGHEMVDALERAGFVQVLFGLESGSAHILKNCRKAITPTDVLHAWHLFKNSKIELTTFLIIGLYGESYTTLAETANLVQQIQKIKYSYYDDMGVLMIYPGTEIYEIAKKEGAIEDSYWLSEAAVPFFTVEWSEDKLFEMKNWLQDRVSAKRVLTMKGFRHQWHLLPQIAGYYYDLIRRKGLRRTIVYIGKYIKGKC